MKLIQAMKKLKDLAVKAEDLRAKVRDNCADMDFMKPAYEDQRATVDGWIQAHSDILKEMMRLRVGIQRTNLLTLVSIELNGTHVSHSIAEWIHRRRDLAGFEAGMWMSLTDRSLKDQQTQAVKDAPITVLHVRRYFDPATRDQKVAEFKAEPSVINAALEVANAVTDLIED